MEYYLNAIRNYTNFKGRTSRKAFWMHFLFFILLGSAAAVIDTQIFGFREPNVISVLFILFNVIPLVAISIRRLHDIGKSGWNYLIAIIPYIGWGISIYWYCKPGIPDSNKYGGIPGV